MKNPPLLTSAVARGESYRGFDIGADGKRAARRSASTEFRATTTRSIARPRARIGTRAKLTARETRVGNEGGPAIVGIGRFATLLAKKLRGGAGRQRSLRRVYPATGFTTSGLDRQSGNEVTPYVRRCASTRASVDGRRLQSRGERSHGWAQRRHQELRAGKRQVGRRRMTTTRVARRDAIVPQAGRRLSERAVP